MNEEELKGVWQQAKEKVKEHWSKLTDDELNEIDGKFDQLSGKIQEKYGKTKEEVNEELRKFFEHFKQ